MTSRCQKPNSAEFTIYFLLSVEPTMKTLENPRNIGKKKTFSKNIPISPKKQLPPKLNPLAPSHSSRTRPVRTSAPLVAPWAPRCRWPRDCPPRSRRPPPSPQTGGRDFSTTLGKRLVFNGFRRRFWLVLFPYECQMYPKKSGIDAGTGNEVQTGTSSTYKLTSKTQT